MTFQSQLSDSVVDKGMDSGIEASDGLRVDDSKLRVQSILVLIFHCKTRVPISSRSRKRQRVYSSTSIQIGTSQFFFIGFFFWLPSKLVLCKFCKMPFFTQAEFTPVCFFFPFFFCLYRFFSNWSWTSFYGFTRSKWPFKRSVVRHSRYCK